MLSFSKIINVTLPQVLGSFQKSLKGGPLKFLRANGILSLVFNLGLSQNYRPITHTL